MSVKRYRPYIDHTEDTLEIIGAAMKEHVDGDYVLHSDYAKLLTSHNALREAVAKMRELENAVPSDFVELINYVPIRIEARAEVDRLLKEEKP